MDRFKMLKRISFLFFTFLICADIRLANTRPSKKQHSTANTCTYEQQVDVAIDFKESKARGAKLLNVVNEETLDSCQENCCQHNGCTLALFHYTNATGNCYLLRCHPPDVCSYTELESFSISTVSTGDEESDTNIKGKTVDVTDEEQQPTDTPDTTDTADIVTTTLAPRITTSRVPTTTELPAQPTTTQQHTTTKREVTETKQITSTSTRYVDITELIDTTDATNLHKNSTNPILKSEVTYNKLSSNGALIASLCFGVLFACAVCVLLGKGWYEGYQRRHYSKVDYLINGMYN